METRYIFLSSEVMATEEVTAKLFTTADDEGKTADGKCMTLYGGEGAADCLCHSSNG